MIKIWQYGNGAYSISVNKLIEAVFAKMVSFKDTRDLILLSYGMNLINDDDFLLLYPSYSSQNLNLPYDSYPEFDLDEFSEDECLAEFRFKKADIPVIAKALQISAVIRCSQGTVCDGIERLEAKRMCFQPQL